MSNTKFTKNNFKAVTDKELSEALNSIDGKKMMSTYLNKNKNLSYDDREDIKDCVRIGIWRALCTFDETKSADFWAHAASTVKRTIQTFKLESRKGYTLNHAQVAAMNKLLKFFENHPYATYTEASNATGISYTMTCNLMDRSFIDIDKPVKVDGEEMSLHNIIPDIQEYNRALVNKIEDFVEQEFPDTYEVFLAFAGKYGDFTKSQIAEAFEITVYELNNLLEEFRISLKHQFPRSLFLQASNVF